MRATIAWQATTLATVGLVVGIPGGLIVGRTRARLVADGLGVSTTVTIPTLAVLLTIPAVLLLVNLIAYFPARTAAQTRPAVALPRNSQLTEAPLRANARSHHRRARRFGGHAA